jgi:hypothetical protein
MAIIQEASGLVVICGIWRNSSQSIKPEPSLGGGSGSVSDPACVGQFQTTSQLMEDCRVGEQQMKGTQN